jgi:hypothetical protein
VRVPDWSRRATCLLKPWDLLRKSFPTRLVRKSRIYL